MTSPFPRDEEREWAADKRDFVADSRDDTADVRDSTADTRESFADRRESHLDAWEQQLESLAAEFTSRVADPDQADARLAARRARGLAREDRHQDRRDRGEAKARRDESAQRRLQDNSSVLAFAFATIAEHLYQADTYDDVLSRIAAIAVATVAGCESASVTLLESGAYRTAAATDQAASAVDKAQYDADEGPCLDAIAVPLVRAPSFPDERWPTLAGQPSRYGVLSSVSYQLRTAASSPAGDGSLNTYAVQPDAFDHAAQELGLVLAAHASLAARAVADRTALAGLGGRFQAALSSRDVIGQAKGILIERLKVTPEEAFDILRTTSQQLNVKLREVARTITETGEIRPREDLRPN